MFYIATALAPTLSWLFLGRIVCGFTACTAPTATAYVAAVTSKEKRRARSDWSRLLLVLALFLAGIRRFAG